MKRIAPAVAGIVGVLLCAPISQARASRQHRLSFEDRVRAQEAIERVYYAHQIGATRPFDQAVPRSALETKVRTYLKQSAALESFWRTKVTAAMLVREAERQWRQSRLPERLRELHAALGHDPELILECLVRPVLVDRLARSFFESDETIHRAAPPDGQARHPIPRRTWEEWWVEVEEDLDATALDVEPPPPGWIPPIPSSPDRSQMSPAGAVPVAAAPGASQAACLPPDSWDNGALAGIPSPRSAHTAVWTGSLMIVWGGGPGGGSAGGLYDPATDAWRLTSTDGAPSERTSHSAVWTGEVMVVWGGLAAAGAGTALTSTGGRYDPLTDRWLATSLAGAPEARRFHTAAWTAGRMMVWGGEGASSFLGSGGLYDPVADSWSAVSESGAPAARRNHVMVGAGDRFIVWGGRTSASGQQNTGGVYDPSGDTWSPTSMLDVPAARTLHSGLWTGTRMIVWGGTTASGQTNTGGAYDPTTDLWTALPTAGAPSARLSHTAVWTGSRMIVWGGIDGTGTRVSTGGQYNPVSQSWQSLPVANAPLARSGHSAVWTDQMMVVWGGTACTSPSSCDLTNTGGRFNPVSSTWTPTALRIANAPSGRFDHSIVWTGTHVIVWGGWAGAAPLATGGRYDPATDSWSTVSTTGSPVARAMHTAVWSGDEMIVWGGTDASALTGTGDRYDPISDSWSPTSMVGAPDARYYHSAIWTGAEMIVWGGYDGDVFYTGGRYDPAHDTWAAMANPTYLTGDLRHRAFWTGTLMVIWGGTGGPIAQRYDPATNSWLPNSVLTPLSRSDSEAVWTGTQILDWGGTDPNGRSQEGIRYTPATDTFSPLSSAGAPTPRFGHTAAWAGGKMVVWGGYAYSNGWLEANSGGRYDPVTNTWEPTSFTGAPTRRFEPSSVAVDDLMVVWGGRLYGNPLTLFDTGGRYFVEGAGNVDGDGDGYSGCGGDCSDADPNVHPGALEACDGIDDDCDGAIDDGNPGGGGACDTGLQGLCAAGTLSCTTGSLVCLPTAAASSETCDGLDNDCDGQTDEGGPGAGLDCDTGQPGVCAEGTTFCANGAIQCQPDTPAAPESCDGLDNDCDGTTDDGNPGGGGACATGLAGVCGPGTLQCRAGGLACVSTVGPSPETCDNLDNDCDGITDGMGTACGTGECAAAGVCIAGADSCVPGSPGPEVCDGLDNDCNGTSDDTAGGCTLYLTSPRGGDLLDCTDPRASQPAIAWNRAQYDKFKVWIGTSSAFTKGTFITSGTISAGASTWTVQAKKWTSLCGKTVDGGALFVRIRGVDADVPKSNPLKKFFSPVVEATAQKQPPP